MLNMEAVGQFLEDHERSGESLAAFARAREVSVKRAYYWRDRWRELKGVQQAEYRHPAPTEARHSVFRELVGSTASMCDESSNHPAIITVRVDAQGQLQAACSAEQLALLIQALRCDAEGQ